jgi:hypothetical protein
MSHVLTQMRGVVRYGVLAAVLAAGTLAASPAAGAAQAAATPPPAYTEPCIPAGHGPGTIPAIAFGRKYGNIRPFSVAIYGDGIIAYKGITPAAANYTILTGAVLGLERLAAAEGFASWPTRIAATHPMPDAATLYVTLRAGCSPITRTVALQGGSMQPAFSELFATLMAATALSNA